MVKRITAVFFALMLGITAAQAEPVTVSLEAFVVTTVTLADGTVQETFTEATEARPGQTVEYRVMLRNAGDETLPVGTVTVAGPVPATTAYLAATATQSDLVTAEFSADDGATFSAEPVMKTVTNEAGAEEQVVAAPAEYSAVRWTLQEALEPGAERTLSYRVDVL